MARVRRIAKSRKDVDTFLLTLEGLARIRLPRSLPPVLSILPPTPLPTSTFGLPLPTLPSSGTTDLLPLAMRLLPKQLHDQLDAISTSLLADLLVTVLGMDWETRVELLGIPNVEERCSKVKEILIGLMSDRGISPATDTPPPSSSKQRQPLALIRRPPPSSPSSTPPLSDDLQPLQDTLSRRDTEITTGARQAITRELTRMTRIPPQSAEYGVSRTYVEWLLALPWKKVSEVGDDLDLDHARKRLGSEHEGLEAVKRRVVEYLAVYRLAERPCID